MPSPIRRGGAGVADLLVPLDRNRDETLHRQLYRHLKNAILSGRLAPGSRLPSTRSLAATLDVSRNTVLSAVDQLSAEGFLEGKVGSGTRITDHLARRHAREIESPPVEDRVPVPSHRTFDASRPFTLGMPALDLFPVRQWARLTGRSWRNVKAVDLTYGDPKGHPALRTAIADHVRRTRGIHADPEQVLVVPGAKEGADLVMRAVLHPGDSVWLEEPGYPEALAVVRANRGKPVPVPVDEDGLDVAVGRRLAPDASLAYVTPSHQYPTGVTMTLERRVALLGWASSREAWIIEDDYDSEFRFRDRPLLALAGLDNWDRVIYLGTFSKTIAPSIRLGYLILPSSMATSIVDLRTAVAWPPSTVAQGVLAEFIAGGHFARHVHRMRREYAQRRAVLIEVLSEACPDLMVEETSDTGLHLTVHLPAEISDVAVARRAVCEGLSVKPLSSYYISSRSANGLVLGFGGSPVEELRTAAERLARAIVARGPKDPEAIPCI